MFFDAIGVQAMLLLMFLLKVEEKISEETFR